MEIKSKYCCPSCDKTIFNRRIAVCEFCGASLPQSLLKDDVSIKSASELDALRAELKEINRTKNYGGPQEDGRLSNDEYSNILQNGPDLSL